METVPESPFSTLMWNDCNQSALAVQGCHRFESEWKCCVSLKDVIAKHVYALRQAKMLTVAVVPHRQADYQMLSGCILPERKPQAVKLLFALLLRREGESDMQPTHHDGTIRLSMPPGITLASAMALTQKTPAIRWCTTVVIRHRQHRGASRTT